MFHYQYFKNITNLNIFDFLIDIANLHFENLKDDKTTHQCYIVTMLKVYFLCQGNVLIFQGFCKRKNLDMILIHARNFAGLFCPRTRNVRD